MPWFSKGLFTDTGIWVWRQLSTILLKINPAYKLDKNFKHVVSQKWYMPCMTIRVSCCWACLKSLSVIYFDLLCFLAIDSHLWFDSVLLLDWQLIFLSHEVKHIHGQSRILKSCFFYKCQRGWIKWMPWQSQSEISLPIPFTFLKQVNNLFGKKNILFFRFWFFPTFWKSRSIDHYRSK